jgi:hypothetical protein
MKRLMLLLVVAGLLIGCSHAESDMGYTDGGSHNDPNGNTAPVDKDFEPAPPPVQL